MNTLEQRLKEYEKQWTEREFTIDKLESRIRELEAQRDQVQKALDRVESGLAQQHTVAQKLDNTIQSYNLKIQEWWWRLMPENVFLRADMESFMREHGIPMERPK